MWSVALCGCYCFSFLFLLLLSCCKYFPCVSCVVSMRHPCAGPTSVARRREPLTPCSSHRGRVARSRSVYQTSWSSHFVFFVISCASVPALALVRVPACIPVSVYSASCSTRALHGPCSSPLCTVYNFVPSCHLQIPHMHHPLICSTCTKSDRGDANVQRRRTKANPGALMAIHGHCPRASDCQRSRRKWWTVLRMHRPSTQVAKPAREVCINMAGPALGHRGWTRWN